MAAVLCKRHTYCMRVIRCRYSALAQKPSSTSVPEKLENYKDQRVTEIIDVRTAAEFSDDHIPGAINLPVLNNEERVKVGTLYNSDKFAARKLGAAIISRNIAGHIDQYFSTKPQEYSPLVYCWRGGQRSYSMALILAQIGFQSFLLSGGHKQYRKIVRAELSTLPSNFQYKVITGPTGSGKTHILSAMKEHGLQVLDLEALAKHKGSVLGLWHGEVQPTQAYFTSLLLDQLQKFTPTEPVWVESESVRIGRLNIPDSVFSQLKQSPRYLVDIPLEERVKHILSSYQNWVNNKDSLKEILGKLVECRGHETVNRWLRLVDDNRWAEFVEDILVNHYDPSYNLSQKKNNQSKAPMQEFHLQNLEKSTVDSFITQIVTL